MDASLFGKSVSGGGLGSPCALKSWMLLSNVFLPGYFVASCTRFILLSCSQSMWPKSCTGIGANEKRTTANDRAVAINVTWDNRKEMQGCVFLLSISCLQVCARKFKKKMVGKRWIKAALLVLRPKCNNLWRAKIENNTQYT